MSETPFLESNALLAVMSDDEDAATESLQQMSRSELLELACACGTLSSLARYEARQKEVGS